MSQWWSLGRQYSKAVSSKYSAWVLCMLKTGVWTPENAFAFEFLSTHYIVNKQEMFLWDLFLGGSEKMAGLPICRTVARN
jgi:hypothetical protein